MASIGSESNITSITGIIPDGLTPPGTYDYLLNVNSVLQKSVSYNEYSNIFDIRTYFINLSSVSIQSQNAALVKAHLAVPGNMDENTNYPYTTDFITFTGDSTTEDIFISINKSDSDSAEAADVHKIAQNIKNRLTSEFASIATTTDPFTDHDLMKKYMDVIVHEISFYYFKEVQVYLGTNYEAFHDKIRKAVHKFGTLYHDNVSKMFELISKNLQEVFDRLMEDFLKKKKTLNHETIEKYLKSFSPSQQYDKTFYYKVRKDLVDMMMKSKNSVCIDILKDIRNTQDNNTVIYFLKVMVDAYLKTAYPSVQYLFISSLMRQYMKKGDFVNTRMGIIAKIYLCFYMVSILHLVLRDISNSSNYSLADVSTLRDYLLSHPLTNLLKYLEAMNRIDLKNETTTSDREIVEIIRELQQKSNSVEKDSRKIDVIQKNIQSARLTLRNVMFNIEIQKKQLARRIAEFWVAFSILLIMTCFSIALLVMKKEFYVYYVTGTTVLAILIYKLVMLIIYLVNKN